MEGTRGPHRTLRPPFPRERRHVPDGIRNRAPGYQGVAAGESSVEIPRGSAEDGAGECQAGKVGGSSVVVGGEQRSIPHAAQDGEDGHGTWLVSISEALSAALGRWSMNANRKDLRCALIEIMRTLESVEP